MHALVNHLWQTTLFAGVMALAAVALRRNSPRTRYWLWLAASLKFLVPFSLLVVAGSRIEPPPVVKTAPPQLVEQLQVPFTPMQDEREAPRDWGGLMAAVWLTGAGFVTVKWSCAWLRVHRAARGGTPLDIAAPVPVLSTSAAIEPGIFGLFRPVLLLPEGIAAKLSDEELRAVLAHELCHLRARDNLTAALHMLVCGVFWFHPLVWWIGRRLIEERELACDERVLVEGNEPEAYAHSILTVCKHYAGSPLACASGVSGADLKKRIEGIMVHQASLGLTPARKAMLAIVGLNVILAPVLTGILQGQTGSEALKFEVASVRPADPMARNVSLSQTPGGGVRASNVRLRTLIAAAYGIPQGKDLDKYVTGLPDWADTAAWDIVAKTDEPEITDREVIQERARQRLRALLAERFQMVARKETRDVPVYELVVAKNGHKLKPSTREDNNGSFGGGRGHVVAENVLVQMLVTHLRGATGRPVIDRTGLTGRFDFTLESAGGLMDKGNPAETEGPSIFTALQEQLGLKLEPARGKADFIVVERVVKPTEN